MNVYPQDNVAAGSMMQEEDLYSVLSAMLRQEEEYQCHGYLDVDDTLVDEICRTKMTEWVFQVVDCTQLQRETASVSIQYLDRFMCTSSPSAKRARVDRKEYQLVVLTTFYIATKIFEPFAMEASLVSRLSRGVHSEEEIVALEYEILVALQWRLNGKLAFQQHHTSPSLSLMRSINSRLDIHLIINRSNITTICKLSPRAAPNIMPVQSIIV